MKLSDVVLIIAILCFVVGAILWITYGSTLAEPVFYQALTVIGLILIGAGGGLKKKGK